jgi:muramidase (phage lysozyme)
MTFPTFEQTVTHTGDVLVMDQYGYTLGIFPEVYCVVVMSTENKVEVSTTAGKFIFNLWWVEEVPRYSFRRFIAV